MKRAVFALLFCAACEQFVDFAGGSDAANADASLVDARLPDAAMPDARLVDAAPIDAPRPDARVVDAAPIDAPAPDARIVDAAPIDAPVDAAIDAPLPDAPPGDAEVPNVLCDSDDVSGLTSGGRGIPAMANFIPLCSGQVLLADRMSNQIVLENIVRGTVLATYSLPSAPGRMDLDASSGVLYVAMPPATFVARVDLLGGAVTTFRVPNTVVGVVAGPPGIVFVLEYSGVQFTTSTLLVMDGTTGAVLQTVPTTAVLGPMAYDAADHQLIAGDGMSLYRYSVDPTTSMLALAQTRSQGEVAGGDLAISPLGGHMACDCSVPQNTVPDYNPADLSVINGGWSVLYPGGEGFSRDGAMVAIGDGNPSQGQGNAHVLLFSVSTHALATTHSLVVMCTQEPFTSKLARYSRGGRILFVYGSCYSPANTASLSWIVDP